MLFHHHHILFNLYCFFLHLVNVYIKNQKLLLTNFMEFWGKKKYKPVLTALCIDLIRF